MKISLRIKDDRIEDIKFKTFGCGAAIATSSMVTELVKGKTVEEAIKISNQTVAKHWVGCLVKKCIALTWLPMHCMPLLLIIREAQISR